MNISGRSAALAAKAYLPRPLDKSRVIVLHDSLSHKPLALHPRIGGSANGHNGVADLISRLQGPDFHRIRIGIGRPPNNGVYHNYVLEKLDASEGTYWGEPGEGVENAWTIVENIVLNALRPKVEEPRRSS
jgi:peptidyl-tRNA hydrolase, PTH1 family